MDSSLDTGRFEALLEGLGRTFGLPDLGPDENGSCLLMFDDAVVTLQQDAPGKHLTVYTQVGLLAADTSLARVESLLAANLFWTQTAGATLSLLPANRALILARRFELQHIELASFEEDLASFLNAADVWREALLKPDATLMAGHADAVMLGALA